jgi:hypothetical protein
MLLKHIGRQDVFLSLCIFCSIKYLVCKMNLKFFEGYVKALLDIA